jgi:hypothetical protein
LITTEMIRIEEKVNKGRGGGKQLENKKYYIS